MAEPLRDHFDARVPRTIARQIEAVWPAFPAEKFVADVHQGFDALALMARGRRIARALHRHLPGPYPQALRVLLRSIGPRPPRTDGDGGMATFLYLPHTLFVADYGLDHFDQSMHALYVLTQRFTGEFGVRPFIERHESAALALLHKWTGDPDAHVRRLVSEGTRPRLPWAGRLRRFQHDPAPVVALLERLKDDPDPDVRRSVANNLNDIGKDHPALLVEIARRWLENAGHERRALVRHALRSLVKQGHRDALALLGYGRAAAVSIDDVRITPDPVTMGDSVTIAFRLRATGTSAQRVLVDLRVHFVKANGAALPKVFKMKAVDLEPGGTASFRKTVSLADLTTRKHYVGRHVVEALINGRVEPLGAFSLCSRSLLAPDQQDP